MTVLSLLVLAGAVALGLIGRQLSRSVWQCQVRLARLEQALTEVAAQRQRRPVETVAKGGVDLP